MALGYEHGNDFGDPGGFKRGTGEGELDKFNQFMRAQPWHQDYLKRIGQFGKPLNLSEQQQKELADIARANGVNLPKDDLSMDQAGNLNQNSRTARNIAIAGIIAAGVLTGGAALGAFGAGGAAGAGAGAAGAGTAGAAGAGVGAAGATGGLLGATSLATGASGVGLGIGAGLPAAATIGGGLAGGAGITGATLANVGGGGGALSSFGKAAGKFASDPDTLAAGGRMLGAGAQASASNRGTTLDAMMEQDRFKLAAAGDHRDSESDAWKKLSHAGYVKDWQQPEAKFSPYTKGIPAPSDAQRRAAALMEEEMLKRLQSGPMQPTDVSKYAKAGKGETAMGLIGAGLSAYDAYRR